MLGYRGEIDLSNAAHFEQQLLCAIAVCDDERFVLDLRDVHYMDSVALSVIVRCARTLKDTGRTLEVVVLSSSGPEKILEIAGLGAIVDIVRDAYEPGIENDDTLLA